MMRALRKRPAARRGKRSRRSRVPSAPPELWTSEQLVSDAVGRLIEFWGFKRHMGRIWTLLYLSERPLSSLDLQGRLQMSAGTVSMTLTELTRWGVCHRVQLPGERREYFEAERNFWKMISRVYRERERVEVVEAIDAMEEAIAFAERKAKGTKDPADRRRAEVQLGRIRHLLDLARLGLRFIDALVDKGRVDASPLFGLLLGEPNREEESRR